MKGSILLVYLLFLSVLFLGVVSAGIIYQDDTFILGEISNAEIASVEGYSSCLTSLGSHAWVHSDNSANYEPSFKCFKDGNNIKIEKNQWVGNSEYPALCTYACHKGNIIDPDLKVGYVNSGTNIGAGLDCGLTIADFSKARHSGGGTGWVSCQYDKATGVISATKSTYGGISKCGYICVDKQSSNPSNIKSHPYYDEYGSDNIGSDLECAIGTTRFYGKCSNFGVGGANYNAGNGNFVKGLSGECGNGNFGYLCNIGQGGGQCEYGVPSDEFSKYEFEDDFTDSADGNDGSSTDVGFVDGKVGKAGDFSGGAKVVIVPDSPSLGGMDEFAIGAWVYADSLGAYNTIGNKRFSYYFSLDIDGKIMVWVGNGVAWTTLVLTSTGTVPVGSWHHVLLTSDSGSSKAYIDGELVGSGLSMGSIPDNNDPFEIGYRNIEGIQPFDGKIDELVLFDRSLSAGDVRRLYNSYNSSLTDCSDLIDNDCDGEVDALVEGDGGSEQLHVHEFPYVVGTKGGDGNDMMDIVVDNAARFGIQNTNFDALKLDKGNADLVCRMLGYKVAVDGSLSCTGKDGRCGFTSPYNNYFGVWNVATNDLDRVNAGAVGNQWLQQFDCAEILSACSNGLDDDGDGNIDALIEEQEHNYFLDTKKGPWEHTSPGGNALSPLFVLDGLIEGEKVKVTNIEGTIDYGGATVRSCSSTSSSYGGAYGGFFDASDDLISEDYLGVYSVGEGVDVPSGATRFYVYVRESDTYKNSYNDNSGGCNFNVVGSLCSDGIDNDGDGDIDYDSGGSGDDECVSAEDSSELSHDLGCFSANDESEFKHDVICLDPSEDDEFGDDCNNGVDDDGDGLTDVCLLDGSNADTCDPDCGIEGGGGDNEFPGCGDDQTMMRLETGLLSPGALWSYPDYNYRLCFDDVFGQGEYGNDDPHDCRGDVNDPDNILLWLDQDSDADASFTKSVVYDIPVCYGPIKCVAIDLPGESCPAGSDLVLVLNSDNKLSINQDDDSVSGLCCNADIEIQGVYWSDMNDNPINLANKNSLVRMGISGIGFENFEAEFEVWKSVRFWFDSKVLDTDSSGFLSWRAGKKEDGSFELGSYYFRVKLEGSSDWESTEENLDPNYRYLEVVGPEVDTPPVAEITGPYDKQVYFLDEVLSFTQSSYDLDDNFDFVWDLNGEDSRVGDSVSGDNYEFVYSFDSTGQKNIILTVTDDRGETDRDQISILVIDSSFILAYIDEPMFGEAFGREVTFDASSTYAIDETIDEVTGARTIECIAGMCPSQTEGCPPDHAESPGCHLPILDAPATVEDANYDDITFTWVFDGNINDVFTAMGDAGVHFTRTFFMVGERHTASLTTSINPSSSSSTEFGVFFDKLTCIVVDEEIAPLFPDSFLGQSYWYDQDFLQSSQLDCFRVDGVNKYGDSQTECCPVGYACNLGSNRCEFTGKTRCVDFDEAECSGNPDIAASELNPVLNAEFALGCSFWESYGDVCAEFVACQCEWDNNKCKAISDHLVQDLTDSSIPIDTWDYNNLPTLVPPIEEICDAGSEQPRNGKCTFDFTYKGDCNSGSESIVRSWTIKWDGDGDGDGDLDEIGKPEYCRKNEDTISCGNVVKLGFFGLFNLIISVLALIGVYFVLAWKKKL